MTKYKRVKTDHESFVERVEELLNDSRTQVVSVSTSQNNDEDTIHCITIKLVPTDDYE